MTQAAFSQRNFLTNRRSSSVPNDLRASSRHFDETLSFFLHMLFQLIYLHSLNHILEKKIAKPNTFSAEHFKSFISFKLKRNRNKKTSKIFFNLSKQMNQHDSIVICENSSRSKMVINITVYRPFQIYRVNSQKVQCSIHRYIIIQIETSSRDPPSL